MAEKTKITFEVDTSELFDRLHDMKGNFAPLGRHIVAALLADPPFADWLGMAVYGVTIVSREPADLMEAGNGN